MPSFTLNVNGEPRTVEVRDPDEPLLYVLRNSLSLTGAKFGCGLGQCGACTVIVDGEAVRSCRMPVSNAAGKKITTIEGLGTPDKPHPLQAAFVAEQAAQCGYCVTGMVMTGAAALRASQISAARMRSRRLPAICAAAARTTGYCGRCCARRQGDRMSTAVAPRIPASGRRARRRVHLARARRRAAACAWRGGARQDARHRRGRRVRRRQWRRLGDDLLGQGRSRSGPADRDSADGGRRARHRRRTDRDDRGRHRADARPGCDRRQQRDHARRRADPAGSGDRPRGADRARRRPAPANRRRNSIPSTARSGRNPAAPASASANWSATSASDSRSMPKRRSATRRRTRSSGSLCARPDIPAKVDGPPRIRPRFQARRHAARPRRSPAGGRREARRCRRGVDQAIPGAAVVRINDFLGVVAAGRMGRDVGGAPAQGAVVGIGAVARRRSRARLDARRPVRSGRDAGEKRRCAAVARIGGKKVRAEFYWPMQSHASMGPSCAVADVRDGKATVWSASQATHRFRETIAKALALPKDAVRVVYLDGSGCYGMNGHDDAAADAALLSKALGRPVRVQWSREDEHGWDPKAPPQLLALEGAVGDDGKIAAWRTEMWIPKATASLPNMPLLALDAAGIAQTPGITTGLISQNGDPPYAVPHQEVVVHWLKSSPLRPSNLRAPGKVANCFAVESFTDVLAAAARRDPVEFRLQGLSDPRGIEVIRRAAALIGWQPRPSPCRRSDRRRTRLRVHPLQAQRELCGDGDRGRRRQGDRGDSRAPRCVRARLRPDHQSGGIEGADRRQHPADSRREPCSRRSRSIAHG